MYIPASPGRSDRAGADEEEKIGRNHCYQGETFAENTRQSTQASVMGKQDYSEVAVNADRLMRREINSIIVMSCCK